MAVIGTWSPNKSGGGSQRRASTRLTAARLLGRIFFDRTKSDINDKRQSFLYTLEIHIHRLLLIQGYSLQSLFNAVVFIES